MSARVLDTRRFALTGLALLGIVTMSWLLEGYVLRADGRLLLAIGGGLLPPLLLLLAGLRGVKRWCEWVALVMVPYACVGVMDVVAGSGARYLPLLLATVSIGVFFAALDASRRTSQ